MYKPDKQVYGSLIKQNWKIIGTPTLDRYETRYTFVFQVLFVFGGNNLNTAVCI